MGANEKAAATVHGTCPYNHSESMWGRCAFCGMTWEQQAEERRGKEWVEGNRRLFIDFPDRDEATVKAEAIREAAQAQRQYATDARTQYGEAEHTNIADWLDDRAAEIDPAVVEGAHP